MALRSAEILDPIEQSGMPVCPYLGIAELAMLAGFDLSTLLHGHGEHSEADAEHRYAEVPGGLRGAKQMILVGRGMTAGEDDALRANSRMKSSETSFG